MPALSSRASVLIPREITSLLKAKQVNILIPTRKRPELKYGNFSLNVIWIRDKQIGNRPTMLNGRVRAGRLNF